MHFRELLIKKTSTIFEGITSAHIAYQDHKTRVQLEEIREIVLNSTETPYQLTGQTGFYFFLTIHTEILRFTQQKREQVIQ